MTHSELSTLYTQQYDKIRDYAQVLCGNFHDAEDIASETFKRLAENMGNVELKGSVQYLRRIAHNLAVDYYRQQSKAPTVQFAELPETDTDNPNYKKLYDTLETLPAKQSYAIYYYYYKHMSYKDIADEMGISVKAVDMLLSRAKHKLRELMAGHNDES